MSNIRIPEKLSLTGPAKKSNLTGNKNLMGNRRIALNGKSLRILFVLIAGCSLYYYACYWWMRNDYEEDILNGPANTASLILDTPGCKIPNLDPYDRSVIALIKKLAPYKCPGPILLSKARNNSITIDEEVLKNHYHLERSKVSCTYQTIKRHYEPKNGTHKENYITWGPKKTLQFETPISDEFIIVHCDVGSEKINQFFSLLSLKFEEEKNKAEANAYSRNELNVLLFQIDSMSRLNFIRQFPKTRSFLENTISAMEMKGYNKVADNTFPNLVPLLTGHFVEYLWNETLKNSMFFDDIDLIWKHYSEKGYRTYFAEDSPYFGTFNYLKRGFRDPPTDYYFRPLSLAIEESKLRKKLWHCVGSQLDVNIMFNYLKGFIKTMQDRPFFAFNIISTMTHDDLNNAQYADEPTFNVLQDLWKMGAFNKTAFIIFGDHGLRFGKIRETYLGKFEERLPFMYVYFPPWYLEKYPHFARSLKVNQRRLITLFDVHATLVHLLNKTHDNKIPDSERNESDAKGLSLLNEISPYRTCEKANILPHWCACQVYQFVSSDDQKALNSAQTLINHINLQLKPHTEKCAVLKLKGIQDARFGQANDIVLKFVKHKNVVIDREVVYGKKLDSMRDYLITLETTPGGGIFEGTVRHYVQEKRYVVLGVSRINLYGSQSQCIDSQELRKYCFCS